MDCTVYAIRHYSFTFCVPLKGNKFGICISTKERSKKDWYERMLFLLREPIEWFVCKTGSLTSWRMAAKTGRVENDPTETLHSFIGLDRQEELTNSRPLLNSLSRVWVGPSYVCSSDLVLRSSCHILSTRIAAHLSWSSHGVSCVVIVVSSCHNACNFKWFFSCGIR